MAQTREIKKRMVAVSNIQRITKTMQMIATAKFTSAVQRTKATQPYTEKIRQLAGEVAAAAGDVDHPLLRGPEQPTGRELVLVISSDRGLCGAYNANVLRKAISHLRELEETGRGFTLETSGKKAIGFFKFQRIDISERHRIGDTPRYEEVKRIADRYMELFSDGQFDRVRVAYQRFESNTRQVPALATLLPLEPPKVERTPGTGGGLYEFSPSSRELLDDLLPQTVRTSLFQAFNDAAVSEHIMR
ncbi:MAG: ATP synthase F1 subunit gamma, partial [Planctomycetota bacterium]